MDIFIEYLVKNFPAATGIFTILGGLVVIGQTYVALSPSKNDDAWLAKLEEKPMIGPILKAIRAFAPIQKKDK